MSINGVIVRNLSILLTVFIGLSISSWADDFDQPPHALTPTSPAILEGSVDSWKKSAQTWYTSNEVVDKRRQMREMSRPLKRPCYYCHTRNFKAYVESTYLISLQMMAVSAEQGVKCKDCHQGQRGLTELGAKSLIQWRYAVEHHKKCSDCHAPNGRFKKLTSEGKASIKDLIKALTENDQHLNVPPKVTQTFLKQLIERMGEQSSQDSNSVQVNSQVLEDNNDGQ
jgi:nitrate/TMAO reductase-like tetraheme cytochrome c subunit